MVKIGDYMECKLIKKDDIAYIFNNRDEECCKFDFGKVGIMGGSVNYQGAVKLASMSLAALRGGAGIARVIVPKNIITLISPCLLEQTLCYYSSVSDIDDCILDLDVLVYGPGSKDDVSVLERILKIYCGKLVIDAGGLYILSKLDSTILKNTKASVVITPHEREFSRLCECDITSSNSISLIKEYASLNDVLVLLKGHETFITDGDIVYTVDKGCAGMATAGSGDVLSGIIGGILGYSDFNLLSICAGAYLAGVAGELAQNNETDISMIASDTVSFIGDAIKYIRD